MNFVPLEPPSWRQRATGILKILALYTLVTAIFSTEAYFANKFSGSPESAVATQWLAFFCRSVAPWYAWALVTPIILAVSQRYHLDEAPRSRALGMHLLTILGIIPLQACLNVCLAAGLDQLFRTFGQQLYRQPVFDFIHHQPAYSIALMVRVPLVYVLIASIYYMGDFLRRYRNRELKASLLETKLVQTQLQVLRMQLQPHFLFNTLNAVSTLMHRDVESAEKMLIMLADLLRRVLDDSEVHEVALKEELAFLDRYLDIEKIRFSNRLTIEKDIAGGTHEALVPKLMLQPLAENAIRHGIGRKSGPGLLKISSEQNNNRLFIKIWDDGPGLKGHGKVQGSGLGLRNTRERLSQLYGDKARLSYGEANEGGFLVTVEMPFLTLADRKPISGAFRRVVNP